MTLRLGAAALLAALTSLTTATALPPAAAGTGTTPPAVGECHDYTMAEGAGISDPTPIVDCADPHTAITVAVVEFEEAPDWADPDALDRPIRNQCYPAFVEALGGNLKVIRRSAHVLYTFIPTKAERDAGAAWLRCDVALYGGSRLMRLPANVTLRGLPLPDSVAKCREGERGDFAITVCSRAHQYRATHSIRYPHSSWPGERAAQRFALRECRERLPRSAFYYEWVTTRVAWRLGYRHAVCLEKTVG